MPPLPFNLGIDTLLRRSVKAALFAAPLFLSIASFVPLVLLDNWVKAEAGLPIHADMHEHPNAALLTPLMSVAVALFVLVGYILGWIINAAALRLAGWPAHQVRNAILHSEIPGSWFACKKRCADELAKLEEEFSQWSTLRKAGVRTFVLREGALKIGLSFFAILLIARAFRSDPQLDRMHWASMLGMSIPLGIAVAALLWFWREHRFGYRAALLNEA